MRSKVSAPSIDARCLDGTFNHHQISQALPGIHPDRVRRLRQLGIDPLTVDARVFNGTFTDEQVRSLFLGNIL